MKVLYISTIAFDANLSIIKLLNRKCDIFYLFDVRTDTPNRLNLNKCLDKDIFLGTEIKELLEFKQYLPLEKTYVFNNCKYSKVLPLVRKQIKLIRLINLINPDIIHCFNELPPAFFPFLILNKRKIILTVHDPIFHTGENSLIKRIIRYVSFRFINKYILLNNKQFDEFCNIYSHRILTIYNSKLSIYEYLKDYLSDIKNNNKTFNILFFGRISSYKGIEYLLDGFAEMEREGFSKIHLTIVGEGSFYFDISEYEQNPKISFINRFVTSQELANFIENSTVVVCPYIDATQSGVIMSAFALNKPVIATNVGGLDEMVDNETTGFIIPPKDTIAIKNCLIKLYKNPELLNKLSNNIKQKYQEGDDSWNNITDNLIDIYKNVIKSS